MKLSSMLLSKADQKDTSMPCAVGDAPRYPYGLTIRLDSAGLDKLGMKALPKVGSKVSVQATGVITSVSQNESEKHSNRNVEIQIQELGVENSAPLSASEKRDQARNDFNSAFQAQKQSRKL